MACVYISGNPTFNDYQRTQDHLCFPKNNVLSSLSCFEEEEIKCEKMGGGGNHAFINIYF